MGYHQRVLVTVEIWLNGARPSEVAVTRKRIGLIILAAVLVGFGIEFFNSDSGVIQHTFIYKDSLPVLA
jgi:hypothetical protein